MEYRADGRDAGGLVGEAPVKMQRGDAMLAQAMRRPS
jgi:hypothetical protein